MHDVTCSSFSTYISDDIRRAFILLDLIFFSDENDFKSFYDSVINESKGRTDEPIRLRDGKPPKRYDSNSILRVVKSFIVNNTLNYSK